MDVYMALSRLRIILLAWDAFQDCKVRIDHLDEETKIFCLSIRIEPESD